MKPVFLAPLVVAAAVGAAAGGYFWITAEPREEEAPFVQEPTPSATAEAQPTPTATPDPLAQPSPEPVPADWLSYTDEGTGVTLRYPPDWVVEKREPPVVPVPEVRFYKPVANPPPHTPTPDEVFFSDPYSALVTVFGDCCSPTALEGWECQYPAEKTRVGGYAADRCMYTQKNPPPGGFEIPVEGARILYTVDAPAGKLHISISLLTWDETGTVIRDTWPPQAEEEAEGVLQSLQVQ